MRCTTSRGPLWLAAGVMIAAGWALAQAGGPESVPLWTAPTVDVQRLLVEDLQRGDRPGTPYRVGWALSTSLAPGTSGKWEALPGGDRRWLQGLSSPGALWTALGLDRFRLAPGAELRVYDGAGRLARRPYTHEDVQAHGQLWLPPVPGDTVLLELLWPRDLGDAEPDLHVGTLSHGYRPVAGWAGPAPEAPQGQGSAPCNVDINCAPGADWQDEKRGVVLMMFTNGQATSACTGSLVNNTALDCTPYVLTAHHCFAQAPPSVFDTISFVFDYERPACEPGFVPQEHVVTGGAERVSFYEESDFNLLRMNVAPPAGWDLYFNGWDRSGQAESRSWTIHHPQTDVKKISHDDDPLFNGIEHGPDHWRVAQWELGTTEGGSSGAPLFDETGLIVGQLHGGTASCSGTSSGPGYDEFGKLSISWLNGAPSLAGFLDPVGLGASQLGGMGQSFCSSPAPRLVFTGASVDDAQGNGDGILDPGDIARLQIALRNEGPLGASDVQGVLEPSGDGVTVLGPGTAQWPDLSPGETASTEPPHFTVDVAPPRACGRSVALTLSAEADYTTVQGQPAHGTWDAAVVLGTGTVVGSTVLSAADFESGAAGFTSVPSNAWVLSTSQSHSPTHSWFVPGSTTPKDVALVMPAIADLPPGAILRFWHRLNTTSGDAGVLEVDTGGGFSDAGALVFEGGYNSIVASNAQQTALAGRLAWSGDLGGWREVEVDLSSLEGQDLTLRWRFVTNVSGGSVGWFVDDVVLEAGVFDCTAPHFRLYPGARCRGYLPANDGLRQHECGRARPRSDFTRPQRP